MTYSAYSAFSAFLFDTSKSTGKSAPLRGGRNSGWEVSAKFEVSETGRSNREIGWSDGKKILFANLAQ